MKLYGKWLSYYKWYSYYILNGLHINYNHCVLNKYSLPTQKNYFENYIIHSHLFTHLANIYLFQINIY